MKTAFTHYFVSKQLATGSGLFITGGETTSGTTGPLPVDPVPIDGTKPKSNPVSTGGTHIKQPGQNPIKIDPNDGLLILLP